MSLNEAVDWIAPAYEMALRADIPVIRMGLQPDPALEKPGVILAGPYHPAFGCLVKSRSWRERVDRHFASLPEFCMSDIVLLVSPNQVGDTIGHGKSNIRHWKARWGISVKVAGELALTGTEMIINQNLLLHEVTSMAPSGEKKEFKSGYIAIVGAPNVGKSTLLNQLLKQKISITASKPQTTRNRILGILNGDGHQIIFVDTPGVHKAQDEFNRGLVETALSTLSESDAVLFMIEPEGGGPANEFILDNLRRIQTPVILVINKIDTLKNKGELLPLIQRCRERFDFKAIIPISALKGDGTGDILGGGPCASAGRTAILPRRLHHRSA